MTYHRAEHSVTPHIALIRLDHPRKINLTYMAMCFLAPTITEMITKEHYQRTNAANLKPDNVDINRHPVHVGYVIFHLTFSISFQLC